MSKFFSSDYNWFENLLHIDRLQLVGDSTFYERILHWRPVKSRNAFQMLLIASQALRSEAPSYIDGLKEPMIKFLKIDHFHFFRSFTLEPSPSLRFGTPTHLADLNIDWKNILFFFSFFFSFAMLAYGNSSRYVICCEVLTAEPDRSSSVYVKLLSLYFSTLTPPSNIHTVKHCT